VAFNALQADEGIDPVTEAEVLLAYDRDQQAEEILLDALKQTPKRPQIPLKLLEIYGKRGDRERFDHYLGMVAAITGRSGKEWESATALHERYFGPLPEALRPAEPSQATQGAADEAVLSFSDVTLDLSPLPTEIPSPQEKGAAQAAGEELPFQAQERSPSIESTGDEPLTFSWAGETAEPKHEPLNEPASPLATPKEPVIDWAVPEPASNGQTRLPEPPPTIKAKTVPPAEEVLLPDLDFELETSAEQLAPLTEQLAPPTASATPLSDERSVPPLPEVHETGAKRPGEGEGVSSALSSERIAAGEPPTTSERVDFSELPTLDIATVMEQPEVPVVAEEEINSRIQLAKAYLEMEDYEGARELLDEVIREGSPEAKARAEALLAQLPM